MRYHLILENVAGKLDERFVDVRDDSSPELAEAIAEFARDISLFRDGDKIRVVEVEG